MVLLDVNRFHIDANGAYLRMLGRKRSEVIGHPAYEFVVDGPQLTPREWAALLAIRRSTGEVEMSRADGTTVAVQWGATVEVVTGRRLVLLVALSTSRWGEHFRRSGPSRKEGMPLTEREREVVRLTALGQTGPEIAEELGIAHDTVRTHVRNSMAKVGARSRAHLVAKVMGEGHAVA